MRILNVGHYYHVKGGSDSYLLALEALLQAHGHRVAPFTSRHPDNRPSQWQAYFPDGLDTRRPRARDIVRYVYSRQAKQQLERMLEHFPADIAHLHIYYGQLTPSIFGTLRRHGIPTLQSLHEYKLTCPVYSHYSNGEICEDCQGSRFYRALPKRCNRGSLGRTLASIGESYVSRWLGDTTAVDQFIAVSDFMRRQMLKFGVLGPERISVLHNFVDPAVFVPQPQAGDYLLYFGRLAENKGLKTLIRAVAPLRRVRLVIAGDGEDRDACQALVDELGADHVSIVGFKQGEELSSLIRNALCVVLPAEWYENCPMSVLEAFACAKPVIGARIGGIPELIEVGRDGWLFTPGDVVALRDSIEQAVSQPQRIPEMGMAARAKIEQQFSPDAHYRQLLDIYRKARQLHG